ncbi:MAG: hypothetical protein H6584_01450 [Flavobacteriales bacterium]|nr:hypothetical protein [Flavobacteriales bacterium]
MILKLRYLQLVLFCTTIGFSQTIEIDENTRFDNTAPIVIMSNGFYQNDIRLAPHNLLQIVENNEEAVKMMKKAKKNKVWAQSMLGGGILLILNESFAELTDGTFNYYVAGFGAGLIGISFPLFSKGKVLTFGAVDKYNTDLESKSESLSKKTNVDVSLSSSVNGIGLSVRF